MGALLSGLSSAAGALGLTSAIRPVKRGFVANDFESGLSITEIINDTESKSPIKLIGAFAPHIPFEFGGTQKIVKDYYPGSPEPAVQILGARESDQTIKGVLKTKRFRDESLAESSVQYQREIDAVRRRGNLVKIQLGEWVRYGFIEETKFVLNRLNNIDYEIKFSIVGLTPPVGYKFTLNNTDIAGPSADLLLASIAAAKAGQNIPTEMPSNLLDDLNGILSGIADVAAKVTGLVDGVVGDMEAIQATANRAIGMIRYYRSYLSRTHRKLAQMYLSIRNIPPIPGLSVAQMKKGQINSYVYVSKVRDQTFSMAAILAQLQSRFEALSRTVPMFRHRVSKDDTLQKISLKYYNSAEHWERIYKHNKLQTTQLTVGVVLEIPKL